MSYPADMTGLPRSQPRWLRYAELTKPRLTSLVLLTTALGYLLADAGPIDPIRILAAMLGTALVGGGGNGLNQWVETERDGRMLRTRNRPFPSGRLSPRRGVAFSLAITGLGVALLAVLVNGLTAALALASWGVYLFAYTPLKVRTVLNTLVGAVSGAIPPVMGWTAARGELNPGAWILFGILFLWQIPHFLAIAWVHRDDYAGGGFRMLPLIDPGGGATFAVVLLFCAVLLPVTLSAALVGLAGWVYVAGASILGLAMLVGGIRLQRRRTREAARHLFLLSILYLPSLLLLMLLDPTRFPVSFHGG